MNLPDQSFLKQFKTLLTAPAIMQSRNYDENNFHLIIKHNQEYFQNSYFIRSAKLWNSLPTEIKKSSSLCSFKTRLNNLYTCSIKSKSYKLPNNRS